MKNTEKIDHAFNLYKLIIEAKNAETTRVIFLGQMFKEIRDDKLYKCLDYESFNEFLACPDLGYQRSTAYSYIRIWEKYVEELNLDPEYLSEIGHKRLQLILPFIDEDVLEWLSRAQTWSYKDLLNQIRKEKGRQPMKEQKEVPQPSKNYLEYVKNHNCIFHKSRKSEKAHFPKTEKAGGLSSHVIPLCHDCHIGELHGVGIDTYLCIYKHQIFGYFYELIEKLYEELNATKSNVVDRGNR